MNFITQTVFARKRHAATALARSSTIIPRSWSGRAGLGTGTDGALVGFASGGGPRRGDADVCRRIVWRRAVVEGRRTAAAVADGIAVERERDTRAPRGHAI